MFSHMEFHLFPTLPSELRIKIWQFTLYEPRIVIMKCERSYLNHDARFPKSFSSSHPSPAALYTCKESRYEALEVYSAHFITDRSPNITYLSLAQDTIRFEDGALDYLVKVEVELKGIRRMIVDVKDALYFTHFHMDTLVLMESLRELELVIRQQVVMEWDRTRDPIQRFRRDFQEARATHPEWHCPRISMVDGPTGERLGVIQGGVFCTQDSDIVE